MDEKEESLGDRLDAAVKKVEDGTQYLNFTINEAVFWRIKYDDEYKARREAADNHRNQLWQITAAAVVLIGFAFTLGLAL